MLVVAWCSDFSDALKQGGEALKPLQEFVPAWAAVTVGVTEVQPMEQRQQWQHFQPSDGAAGRGARLLVEHAEPGRDRAARRTGLGSRVSDSTCRRGIQSGRCFFLKMLQGYSA